MTLKMNIELKIDNFNQKFQDFQKQMTILEWHLFVNSFRDRMTWISRNEFRSGMNEQAKTLGPRANNCVRPCSPNFMLMYSNSKPTSAILDVTHILWFVAVKIQLTSPYHMVHIIWFILWAISYAAYNTIGIFVQVAFSVRNGLGVVF